MSGTFPAKSAGSEHMLAAERSGEDAKQRYSWSETNEDIGVAPPRHDASPGRSPGGAPPMIITSDEDNNESARLHATGSPNPGHHRRSSSFLKVKHVEQTRDELVDSGAEPNANAEWVNLKGAWVIHIVLILLGRMIVDEIPGISNAIKWTIVNLCYMTVSYIMFHYVTGTPFQSNAGAYDDLTLWEQIDNGEQYTPAKKYLTSVPIGLFLISTHYSHYNPWLFSLNLGVLLFVLFPKLPILHRSRFLFFPRPETPTASEDEKTDPTPTPPVI